MTTMACELPPQVLRVLSEFLEQRKSGNLQLDITQGEIVAYKLTVTGRFDKSKS